MRFPRALLHAFLFLIFAHGAIAHTPRIDPAGVPGAMLVCGGDASDAALQRFIDLAGGKNARIVVIDVNDAKAAARLLERLTNSTGKRDGAAPRLVRWKDAKPALKDATGVWLIARQPDLAGPMLVSEQPLREECLAMLKRSGVIATSGANLLDDHGLGLLPMTNVRSLLETKKGRTRDGQVTFEVAEGACLLVKGRALSAVGEGTTTLSLAASRTLPERTIELRGKAQEDLTALRRAALDRGQNFPPAVVDPPVVPQGTLFIVGGGAGFDDQLKQFVKLAGGEGKAVVVIFQTAAPDPLSDGARIKTAFQKAGARKAIVLNARTQADVESSAFLDALKEATGVWFGGGRQWRFVDCYENTKALPLLFDVLQRGGAIGGTSAGATIQGDYLCRGGVFNNFDIRYEGYERGLGFLKGVAIDQHFTQRKRHADMTSLVKTYPQYLGIGIDEATALVVRGSVGEVVGQGKVFFYDTKRKLLDKGLDYEALSAGGQYELKERRILRAGR